MPAHLHGVIINSGASSHFCLDKGKFITYSMISVKAMKAADSCNFQAIGQGDIKLVLPNASYNTPTLPCNVLYTLAVYYTLISTSHMKNAGFTTYFEHGVCKILNSPAKSMHYSVNPEGPRTLPSRGFLPFTPYRYK